MTMTDIYPIKDAIAHGYDVYWNDGHAWFLDPKQGIKGGPYTKLEDAAYAALSDYEIRRHQMSTKLVEIRIDTGFVECFHELDLDVPVDATDDEIVKLVQDEVDKYVTVTWKVV